MKVVILCGGKGTRLHEETEYRPKPMVPLGNRPILWHIMKTYAFHGHKEFILCLGYKGEVIKDYFRNYTWMTSDITLSLGRDPSIQYHNKCDEDWTVTLADTGEETLTAGRIKRIEKYIGNDSEFLVTYGDGVGDVDITAAIKEHRQSGRIVTLTAVHPPGRFGELRIDNASRVLTFNEKPQVTEGMINGGYFTMNRKVFDYLNNTDRMMFEDEPLRRLAADGELMAYKHRGFWQPMDTYQEFLLLNRLWAEGRAPWKKW